MTSYFNEPLLLGQNLRLKNRVFLAPLAGVSDVPFRRICQELGAGLTYVEMLSATALLYKSQRTFAMMARDPSECVLGVQVTGPDADQVGRAIKILDEQGFDTIDINMGCPVRKVVGAGAGSAILKDQARVSETVQNARISTSRPLSAKFRLGYTREDVNVRETTSRVIAAEVDMFTIHGRTRSESYDTPVDLAGIAQGIDAARSIPEKSPVSVGNGDVFDFASADRMRLMTGCQAVMVSRGALGNPWVFAEILAGKPVRPTLEEWLDTVMRHIDYHIAHYGNQRHAAVVARKHLLWYCKGFPGTKALRERFNMLEDLGQVASILKAFAASLPPTLQRFSGQGEGHDRQALASYDPKFEMDRTLDRGVGDENMIEQP